MPSTKPRQPTPPPHIQRLTTERDELDDRVTKLLTFINNPKSEYATLDTAEQTRLRCQLTFMRGYLGMLNERLDAHERNGQ